jgi:regulator of CtrA degradation
MSSTSLIGPARDITPDLIDALYMEAMLLAEEAREHFSNSNIDAIAETFLAPVRKVELSCESLKVTTRLMHAIAWLLNRKAYFAGELTEGQLRHHNRILGNANNSNDDVIITLDPQSRYLVHASQELFARLKRLEARQMMASDIVRDDMLASAQNDVPSPVLAMQEKLRQSIAG